MTHFGLVELVWLAVASIQAGGATGVLAGLFGVGGGTVIVPALYEVFDLYGVPDATRMPLCVGTSLAIIAPTSLASFRSHLAKGGVERGILTIWGPLVVLGVIAGDAVGAFARPEVFKVAFVAICALLAVKLLFNPPQGVGRTPSAALLRVYGAGIGFFSALIGIGGGLLANLALTWHGFPIRKAVATSSGVGVFVSIPGALAYMVAGWGHAGLPPLSAGYVSLVAVALLTPISVYTTRWGVTLAHSLNRRRLEVALALYLVAIATRFVVSLWPGA